MYFYVFYVFQNKNNFKAENDDEDDEEEENISLHRWKINAIINFIWLTIYTSI